MTLALPGAAAAGVRAVALDRQRVMAALRAAMADQAACTALLDGREGLVSDYAVALPDGAVAAIGAAVALLDHILRHLAGREINSGPLCFDFHLTARGPRLIEINTNPGGLLLAAALTRAVGGMAEVEAAALAFAGGGKRIAIIDDGPERQFLWPEFLLYRTLFRCAGLDAHIHDAAGFNPAGYDAVYNRLTDFQLELPGHAALGAAWRGGRVVLTPDPVAHAALSDKRLLVLLSDRDALMDKGVSVERAAAVSALVPRAVLLEADNEASLWGERRHLFFKPAIGHAAKAVYRGDKISRATWAGLPRGATIAQDFVPPTRLDVGGCALKCDLRAFVHDGRVVVLAARLYRGQVTNFRTPSGGFAPVLQQDHGRFP